MDLRGERDPLGCHLECLNTENLCAWEDNTNPVLYHYGLQMLMLTRCDLVPSVSFPIKENGHVFKDSEVHILEREDNWFARGVKTFLHPKIGLRCEYKCWGIFLTLKELKKWVGKLRTFSSLQNKFCWMWLTTIRYNQLGIQIHRGTFQDHLC